MGNQRAREFMLRQADEAEWERVNTEPRSVQDDVNVRGIGVRRLQLIVAPSFEDVSVWELWQTAEWQLICPRVVQTEPAMRVVGHDMVPFASTTLERFFERVAAITLPLRPDMSGCGGLDGTMYEIAIFGDLYSGWRFQWWSESPEQWRPLVDLADEMHSAFSTAVV